MPHVSPAHAAPSPALATLAQKPSWFNRAGRVDRSACVELRASDIWRKVRDIDWREMRSVFSRRQSVAEQSRAYSARGRAGSLHAIHRPHVIAFAHFTVHAERLADLHETRGPLQLAGDYRSIKSNAMNTHYRDPRTAIARNPNRGGMRTKKLGIWSGCDAGDEHSPRLRTGWTQTLRLERWRLHPRLTQHFLICPSCQRKHLKLFMPLATQNEIDDARIAEGWVKMLDARQVAGRIPLDRESLALRARLIDRYAPIFRTGGRDLRCRKCLGVRYGEVKWPRHAAREAQLQAEHEITRAREQAEQAAADRATQEQLAEVMRQVIDPEWLQQATDELRRLQQRLEQEQQQQRKRMARLNRHHQEDRPSRNGDGEPEDRRTAEVPATNSGPVRELQAALNRRAAANRELARAKAQLARLLLCRAKQIERQNISHHPPE